MTIETVNKMNKTTKKEAENFVKSSKTEDDFYNVSKENLINLGVYLRELQQKKIEYEKQACEIVKAIKDKNDWVVNVEPAFNWKDVELVALAPNYPNIGISENPRKEGSFKITSGYSETYLFVSRRKRREEIVNNSKEELKEIKNIIDKFDYTKEKNGIITCSKNYLINPENFSSIIIRTRDVPLFKIFKSEDQYKIYSFLTKKTTDDYFDIIKKFTLKK